MCYAGFPSGFVGVTYVLLLRLCITLCLTVVVTSYVTVWITLCDAVLVTLYVIVGVTTVLLLGCDFVCQCLGCLVYITVGFAPGVTSDTGVIFSVVLPCLVSWWLLTYVTVGLSVYVTSWATSMCYFLG